MNKINNNFIKYGLDQYIVTFQDYYRNNLADYKKNLSIMKSALDEESFVNIDRFLQLMLKLPLPSRDFMVRINSIYSKEELRQIQEERKYKSNIINKYYEKYNLEGWEKLEINVFKYHCGLKKLPKEIRKNLKGKVFIDGGAFWGDSMLVLNDKYSPSKIICFEPNTVNYNHLSKIIDKNKLEKLVEFNKIGLSNKKEKIPMNFISKQQNHGASVVFSPIKAQYEIINLDSLDNYLLEKTLDIGLIKLDVEGYGVQAIKGAEQTIKKHLPVISCAIYHNPKEFFDILPLISSYNNKYKFMILPLSQDFILKEVTLLAWL